MQVEVNETNIDKFGLVQMTGNTREFMLSQAAEANSNGHILSVEVPDEIVLEQNVFDVYESEAVDPKRLDGHCHYELVLNDRQAEVWVCLVHGQESKYEHEEGGTRPCLEVDPWSVPKRDDFTGKSCAYSTVQDPINGTTYFCLVHGSRSKYDVANNPGAPCLAVDPE